MLLAQELNIEGKIIKGPLPSGTQFTNLASVVNLAIPIVFSIAGIILFVMIIASGFTFLTSMGDPKKAQAARARLTSAFLGILVILFAYWIYQIVQYFLLS